MVEEEEWVAGRRGEITGWVATKDKVTGSVHTHEVVKEVVRRSSALKGLPERLVVLALEEGHNVVVLEPSFSSEAGDVSGKAARVVP